MIASSTSINHIEKCWYKMSRFPLAAILAHSIIFLENINDNELEDQQWDERLTVFAEVKPLYDNKCGSLEKFSFGNIVTEAFFMFKIRFTEAVNTKMRIKFRNRLFEIKRIINVGEKSKIMQIIGLEL